MNLAMAGFNPSVLDEREVRYQCDCSRERTEQMLLSLGRKELEKLRDEDPHCEVVCHFCHTKYEFDLNKLVNKAVEKAALPFSRSPGKCRPLWCSRPGNGTGRPLRKNLLSG